MSTKTLASCQSKSQFNLQITTYDEPYQTLLQGALSADWDT